MNLLINHFLKSFWLIIGTALLAILGFSFVLAWVSTGFNGVSGWFSFFAALLIASAILFGGWLALKDENAPRWLGALLVGAAVLRLVVGAFWFVTMPKLGHGSPAERAGYIMADANSRDRAAWRIASSEKPLWSAFQGQRKVDQYGGMLFISALIYRYIGGVNHQPLLMVVFTSAVSALGILFTWSLARRAWDSQIADWAAWIFAFYPEAILLGSSQMREAFTMTLVAISFYGLTRYIRDSSRISIAWMIIPIILYAPLSPPFALLLTGLIGLTLVITLYDQWKTLVQGRWLWIVLVSVILVVFTGIWLALRQFTPEGMNNPLVMLSWWLRKSAYLQAYRSEHASGLIQYFFDRTPLWIHLPLLLTYGVVQPFLPAALGVPSLSPIWPWITQIRSIGWTIVLISLIYAPVLAFHKKDRTKFTIALIVVVWLGIFIAAYRGGSDLWDNPRYRTTFASLHSALVAWTWVNHRRQPTPWFRRFIFVVLSFIIWLVPWFIRRYTAFQWPVESILLTLAFGSITALLLLAWDLIRNRSK